MAKDRNGREHRDAGSPLAGTFARGSAPAAAAPLAPPMVWPATDVELERHRVGADDGLSRRQQRLQTGDYEAAVTPEIAEQVLLMPSDLAADLEEATADLARLDAIADRGLPGGIELAPLQSVLLRTESASSSQIEGLTTSAKSLALAELGRASGENAQLVLSNVRAMNAALELAERADLDSILAMHAELMRGDARHAAGELRTQAVWIGGSGPRTAGFVAPRHERVPAAMDDLVRFMGRDDIPALAHAALAHAQFETIHPFTDGNGRTGRALVHAMLRRAGAQRRIAVPISAGLLTDPEGYFTALEEYRGGDARPILETFARSTRQAVTFGERLLADLESARDRMRERLDTRRHSATRAIVDLAIAQPVLDVRTVVDRLGVSDVAAGRALGRLAELGIIRPANAQTRKRIWFADEVLDAHDQFAQSIRRARR